MKYYEKLHGSFGSDLFASEEEQPLRKTIAKDLIKTGWLKTRSKINATKYAPLG